MNRHVVVLGLVFLIAVGCGPSRSAADDGAPAPAAVPGAGRTLVIMSGAELPSFASKPLQTLPNPRAAGEAVLNANLTYIDERGLAQPYLTEALPELNSGDWRVLPDGRMETIHRLRPNLTWHDGQPLTADDYAFAFRVYSTPEFGASESGAFRLIEDLTAP